MDASQSSLFLPTAPRQGLEQHGARTSPRLAVKSTLWCCWAVPWSFAAIWGSAFWWEQVPCC